MRQAMDFFLNMNSWVSGLVFLVLMFLGWWIGVWVGSRRDPSAPADSHRIEDASLALFGLVIAFWFAGAAARYQQRKVLLREDAIAIGEFSTVASALKEPVRSEIKAELVPYVHQRLVFGTMSLNNPEMPHVVAEGRAMQGRLWSMVEQALAADNKPSVQTALINAFNGMVEAADKRLYGTRDRVPETIIVMLVILGVFTTFSMGRLRDQHERRTVSILRVGAYIVLVCLVFTVTVDLEQPRRGIMQVSPVPMQDLLQTLTAPPQSRLPDGK